jgi:predicted nucleic acid-binding Zn ribbon protein
MGNAAKYAARKWERLDPDRKCVVCGKALPFTRRSDAKYCSDPCRSIASYAKEKPRRQARAAARKAARAAGDVAA